MTVAERRAPHDALAGEWLKLRSARSTWYTLGVLGIGVLGALALTWYVAHRYDGASPADQARLGLSGMEPLVLTIAELAMAVFGTLVITGEFSSGMIHTSAAAVPSRRLLLATKGIVVAGIALAGSLTSVLATSVLTQAIIGDRPVRYFHDPGFREPRLVLAQVAVVAILALVALSLGTVLRSSAGGIAAIMATVFVLPIALRQLPEPWGERVTSLLPDALPGQLAGTHNVHTVYGAVLPPAAAAVVMAAYIVVPLAIASVVLARRDL